MTGLARYAATHRHAYRRIEAVAKIDEDFKVLDLTNADVRSAVGNAPSAEALYRGPLAQNYVR